MRRPRGLLRAHGGAAAQDVEGATLVGVDVYFIGSGDLSQSMGYTGQHAHPEVQKLMDRGVAAITGAGRIAGCSCPDNLIPKFLGLGDLRYGHMAGEVFSRAPSSPTFTPLRSRLVELLTRVCPRGGGGQRGRQTLLVHPAF